MPESDKVDGSEEQEQDQTESPENLEKRGLYRVPRRSAPLRPDLQLYEVKRGTKPGSRFVRITPSAHRPLKRTAPGSLQATAALLRPRTLPGQIWSELKRIAIGSPLATSEAIHERLDKVRALAIFSSDALSSSAYATEEILLALVIAGSGALDVSIPIAIAIAMLLVTVAFSYRQTVRAYPNGGGSYTVARENLGMIPGLTAAAALIVDYILTVAVSVSAGIAAITSAVPELYDERVLLGLFCIWIIVLGNLRGVRESGSIFAVPTYFFIISFAAMLAIGFIRYALGAEADPVDPEAVRATTSSLGVFLVLRAFSSGCSALTGIEAMANGVPAFKPPESKNAATTLAWMAAILTVFFVGLTVLAHLFQIVPVENPTVVSQIAKATFGETPPYYLVQVATMLILLMATNSSFAGFPRLASVMANDRFLPHHMAFRGDRLAFSAGILVLGLAASVLLVIYTAETHRLIPLYAVGVFISFSLSQSGMVIHWLRSQDAGRRRSMLINGIGAVATGVVAVVTASAKFTQGAWMALAAIPVLVIIFERIHHHYQRVSEQLAVHEGDLTVVQAARNGSGHHVVVPVDGLNRAVLRTVEYARTLSNNVTAVHVTDDLQAAEQLREEWEENVPDVPIVIVESPYRALVAPFLAYIDAVDRANPNTRITVVLPEFVPPHFWQRLLHNQPAARLKRALLSRPNTAVVDVLYHLK